MGILTRKKSTKSGGKSSGKNMSKKPSTVGQAKTNHPPTAAADDRNKSYRGDKASRPKIVVDRSKTTNVREKKSMTEVAETNQLSDQGKTTMPRYSKKQIAEKKIRLIMKENPRRKGTKTYDIYALYKDGMTVAEFITAGGRAVDVKSDVAHKFIELTD